MRYARILLLISIILLGLAAGIAKMMEMPQEVEFFGAAGVSAAALSMFGAAQAGAALLMIFRRTRFWAAIILALCFGASAWLIYESGQIWFAAGATVPVILTLIAGVWRKRAE